MSTLAEIEAAADALPAEQKQQLMLFLASRLRKNSNLPLPQKFSSEQIANWITQDEEDLNQFRRSELDSK